MDEAAALVAEDHRVMAQSAREISELCLIAGCPERAAEFIAAGRTEAEVRRVLIEARRPQHGYHRALAQDWATPGADPVASPVVAAVEKLVRREPLAVE